MTFEQALTAAVAGLSAALAFMFKNQQAREDKIHEQHRTERAALVAQIETVGREFTAVLIRLAGADTEAGSDID